MWLTCWNTTCEIEKLRWWMVVLKFFYTFSTSLRKYYNLCIRIIDDYFATHRFEVFRFCLRWCFFKNIDQDRQLFNFLSISGKVWCELWQSSHNEIPTPLSQCPSSGYLKNHWGLELFLKRHWGKDKMFIFFTWDQLFH